MVKERSDFSDIDSMHQSVPILLPSESADTAQTENTLTANINVWGNTFKVRIAFEDKPTRLSELVPLARQLSSKITQSVMEELHQRNIRIPCGKGCCMCCRYLTPLCIPEASRTAEEIYAAPPHRRRNLLQAHLLAARQIMKSISTQLIIGQSQTADFTDLADLKRLSHWYTALKLDCPFLNEGICTNYEQRPLACREHLVIGSARQCRTEQSNGPQMLRMPLSILDCLAKLASELEQTEVDSVMLPMAPAWYNQNMQRANRTWPAKYMLEKFLHILCKSTSRSPSPFTCSDASVELISL